MTFGKYYCVRRKSIDGPDTRENITSEAGHVLRRIETALVRRTKVLQVKDTRRWRI